MDFNIDAEQTMIKNAAHTFFSKEWSINKLRENEKGHISFSTDIWKKMCELGWAGMLISEMYGGMESEYIRLCPILEEMGRTLCPSPYLASCIVAASILLEAGNEEIKSDILSKIATGELIVTFAKGITGKSVSQTAISTEAEINGNDYILKGSSLFVPFAKSSDYIICCAKDKNSSNKGISLLLVDTKTKGIEINQIPTFSVDSYDKVTFNDVHIPRANLIGDPGNGWNVIDKLLPMLLVSKCMEIVGGIQKVLEMTVQFAKDRSQFGNPIGSFQVIQYYLANMAIDVEATKCITEEAAWKISSHMPCKIESSMAKSWAGEAYKRVTAQALQIHGAMGFTEEYDLQFYYKQAKSLHLMYGGGAYHRDIVASELGY